MTMTTDWPGARHAMTRAEIVNTRRAGLQHKRQSTRADNYDRPPTPSTRFWPPAPVRRTVIRHRLIDTLAAHGPRRLSQEPRGVLVVLVDT